MCDVAKYSKMYKDIKNLQPEDTLQLVLESKTKDEKEFFAGANALYKQIFKEDYYIVNDGMGVNVIPVNRIATIRIDRDIPTV